MSKLTTVENSDRAFGSALQYRHVCVADKDGKPVHLLMTESEFNLISKRASTNLEDLPGRASDGAWALYVVIIAEALTILTLALLR